MTDVLTAFLHDLMSSPWIYLALFTLAAVDGFLPVVPSESIVITAGVFAAAGQPDLVWVVAVAAAGAFVGDNVAYLLGRLAGPRLVARTRPGSRRRAALDRASRAFGTRGGLLIVVCRHVPGARTAAMLTAGAVDYPRRRFAAFASIAAVIWAGYAASIGYLGGLAFEEDPLKGLVLGIGLALALTAAVESGRHLLRRRRAGRPGDRQRPQRVVLAGGAA
jgi:membrane-associated protein